MLYVIMGLSGCGKTTVGQALAERLGCPFHDGDDFHPPENVAKMARGVPLDDADRTPWLAILRRLITDCLASGQSAVLACSALKQNYRDRLGAGNPAVTFVYLSGSFDLIARRMQGRPGHYMKARMLRSQFEALEEPDDAIVIDIDQEVDAIVSQILRYKGNLSPK